MIRQKKLKLTSLEKINKTFKPREYDENDEKQLYWCIGRPLYKTEENWKFKFFSFRAAISAIKNGSNKKLNKGK